MENKPVRVLDKAIYDAFMETKEGKESLIRITKIYDVVVVLDYQKRDVRRIAYDGSLKPIWRKEGVNYD